MVKRFILFVVAVFSVVLPIAAQNVRMPAEWENQGAVHLSWFGNERRDSVLCRVMEALQPDVGITLNIPADSLKPAILKYLSNYRLNPDRINLVTDPYVDFWTRDPLFFVSDKGLLKVVCFNYSMYGVYPEIAKEPIPEDIKRIGEYDERLAKRLNLPITKSEFVFEGGGIETNGKGTFLIIREMALQRNPGKSLAAIESELKQVLGAKKIIWLKDGLAEDKITKDFGPFHSKYFGGGANMHVDELCRFINENTVLLPYIPVQRKWSNPVDSINHFMLEENYRILRAATTYEGKKLAIFRLPMPEVNALVYPITIGKEDLQEMQNYGFKEGDTIYRVPASSYVNFFVSNRVVLIPKYWKPGMSDLQRRKDNEAREVIQKLFPDRKVIAIYALSVNRGGGGIHCMTHEQPGLGN